MTEAEEGFSRVGSQQHSSIEMSSFPADLLRKLVPRDNFAGKFVEQNKDTEEIELSLGLSLNGRFGVDPKANKLKRSSSIPEFMNPVKDEDAACLISTACTPLIRTYSLPTETEEELRKRKELQSLRRMEAKRKRSEKQRNAKASRDRYKGFGEENSEVDKQRDGANGKHLQDQCVKVLNEFSAMRMPSSVSSATGSYGLEVNAGKKSSSEVNSSPESEQKPQVSPGVSITNTENFSNFTGGWTENHSGKSGVPKNGAKEIARNILEDMPCVSTKGHGPNGKRIEGFLYRYRKGEEVRIVCVCHGSFLTPAEFVKHAGGGDVAYPLKHIVVSPSFL